MLRYHDLDRFQPAPDAQTAISPETALALLIQDTQMVDIWRHLYPADSIYTCFS